MDSIKNDSRKLSEVHSIMLGVNKKKIKLYLACLLFVFNSSIRYLKMKEQITKCTKESRRVAIRFDTPKKVSNFAGKNTMIRNIFGAYVHPL